MRIATSLVLFFGFAVAAEAQTAESTPMTVPLTVCSGNYCQTVSGALLQRLLQNGWRAVERKVDQIAGVCGSQVWQRIFVADSICFNYGGTNLAWKYCSAGKILGYKKVDFSAACTAHDDCYGRSGAYKHSCDTNLALDIMRKCDKTLTGGTRALSRDSCHKVARLFYTAVKDRGCDAYLEAQHESGNSDAACD